MSYANGVGRLATGLFLVLVVAALAHGEGGPAYPTVVEVRGGTVKFEVGTSVPALGVHGQSSSLQGRATMRGEGQQVVLEQLEATLPVKSLGTGIGQRDEHMRKYIFTTADGQTPDLHFAVERASCPAPGGHDSSCTLAGQLSVRGVARPFKMTLKVSPQGQGFKAAGEGEVKLSEWGIERPSQFGVRTSDEVKLHLEFTAAPTTRTASQDGAR